MSHRAAILAGAVALGAGPGFADASADAEALAGAIHDAGCVVTLENAEAILASAGLTASAMQSALATLLSEHRAETVFDGTLILTADDCDFTDAEALARAVAAAGCTVSDADGAEIASATGLDRRLMTYAVQVLVWQGRAQVSDSGELTLTSGECS